MGETTDDAGLQADATPEVAVADAPSETRAAQAGAESIAVDAEARERDAFDRLAAEAEGKPWQRPAAAAPSPADSPEHGSGEGDGQTKPAAAQAGQTPADKAATPRPAGYEGLSDVSFQALSRTKLLPPAETWKAMDPAFRASLVTAAQATIKNSTREFQQRQQAAAKPANDSAGGQPSGAQASAPNVTATAAGGSANRTAPTLAEPNLDAVLSPVVDLLGDEGAKPIRQAMARLVASNAQLQQQHTEAIRLQQEQHDAQLAETAQRFYAPQEQRAIEALRTELPGVDFDDPGHREPILENALQLVRASVAAGKPMEWQQAIEQAGRSMFLTDIQQNAQQRLLQGRAASLRGTPERGTAKTPAPKAKTPEDKERQAFEKLEAGEDPVRIRASLSA